MSKLFKKNKTKFSKKKTNFSSNQSNFFNEIQKAIEFRDEKVYRKLSIEFSKIWLNKYSKKLNLIEEN